MPNANNVFHGPLIQIQISSSAGTTDVGYVESATFNFDDNDIDLNNNGEKYQATGHAKLEVIGKQTDSALITTIEQLKTEEGYVILTSIDGGVWTYGKAIAQVSTARPFTSTDGHTYILTMERDVQDESDFQQKS